MNHKKKGVDIYSDISYQLLLSFQWIINHGVDGGKFMCMVRWRGKVRVLIGYLAMYGGF